MARRRISVVFAAAALLALPVQPVARADTGANIVEEVDFATSCSPAVPSDMPVNVCVPLSVDAKA